MIIFIISLGYKQLFWLTMLGKYLYSIDRMIQVSKITMSVNSKPHSYIGIPQSCLCEDLDLNMNHYALGTHNLKQIDLDIIHKFTLN